MSGPAHFKVLFHSQIHYSCTFPPIVNSVTNNNTSPVTCFINNMVDGATTVICFNNNMKDGTTTVIIALTSWGRTATEVSLGWGPVIHSWRQGGSHHEGWQRQRPTDCGHAQVLDQPTTTHTPTLSVSPWIILHLKLCQLQILKSQHNYHV